MKAVTVTEPGGPEVLTLAEVPDPAPGTGELLLRVRATAVNRADILQRRGLYPPPPGVTDIPGLEAVGEVVEVPAGIDSDLRAGDRVMCLVGGGAYAELLAVPASNCMRVPDGMAWTDAAAIPEVFLTAYQGLVRLGHLDAGEVAVVHSIASGVGMAAAQICSAIGARCIGTSRSPERAHAAAQWGVLPVHVEDGQFAEQVRSATDGHGADVILDLVGAKYLAQNLACLARHGRLVLTGFVGGRTAELDMGRLLAAQGTILASTLRGRTTHEKADIMAEFGAWAMPLFADGTLRPVIEAVMPLGDVAAAHALVESDSAVGKVVLEVAP